MPEFARSLAVVIGIDHYRHGIASLQTAANDAREIAHILEHEHNYDQVWLFLDQEATLPALQQLFEQTLAQNIQPDDRLFFYFAGHGIALNGDEGPEGYLIPQDAKLGETTSYLPMPQLQAALSALPCRHFLGILDCCFAGAFRWSSTRDIGEVPEVLHRERYDRFIQDPAWQAITSAAYDQKALDSLAVNSERGQTGKHSPFAAALIEALAGKADVYPPAEPGTPAGDGVITATELYLYLRDRVEPPSEALSQRQTPGIWPLKKHDKGEYIFLAPGHVLNLPPAPPLDESKNPYRGLQSFEAEQSDLFFGRSALTAKLGEFVSQQPLTVVLGASGSGKSSLVKAGLIPDLKQQDAKATQPQWQILAPLRPGESPFKALSNALTQETVSGFSVPEAGSALEVEMLTQYMATWSQQHPGLKLLLAIDQFEELITLCRDEQEREQFLSGLAQAVTAYPDQLRLVLTLRSDFEPQFQDTALKDHWSAARFVVPPMTRSELREAIEEPASKRVMYFQSDDPKNPLIDQLIDEVAEMPGALPLLAFTLSELYLKYLRRQKIAHDRGDSIDRAITEADYKELGGVARSLTQRADQEYEAAKLEGVDEITIRNVMLRMVTSNTGELTRRRVQKAELMYPEPKNEQVQKLIKRFSAVRLLVEGLDTENQKYVEPAHDQLVIGWGKIKNWLNERQTTVETVTRWQPGQAWFVEKSATLSLPFLKNANKETARPEAEQPLKVNLPLQRELTTAADHWNSKKTISRNSQAVGFLWNGDPRLPQLEQTQQSEDNWFNARELEFVNRSIQQKRNNFRRLVGTIAFVFTALTGLTIFAFYQLQQAQRQRVEQLAATAEALLATQPVEAEVNAIAAVGLSQFWFVQFPDHPQFVAAEDSLLNTQRESSERNRLLHDAQVNSVVLTSDSKMIASGGRDSTVKLWNAQTGMLKRQLTGHRAQVNSVAFSPDNRIIASGSDDNTIRLWDTQTGKSRGKPLTDHKGRVSSVAFSPDGKTIASGSEDHTIRLWDVQTGKPKNKSLLGHGAGINSIAFSPDGKTIASGGDDNTIRLWDTQTGKSRGKPLTGHEITINSIAFSPDGKTIASGGGDNTIRLWDTQTGKSKSKPLLGHGSGVNSIAFSPDGKTIASGGGDNTIRLWDTQTGKSKSKLLIGHESSVMSVAFSSDGETIVSGSWDKTLRLWNVPKDKQLIGHKESVTSVTFSNDGETIVSGSWDGSLQLWDTQTGMPKAKPLLRHNVIGDNAQVYSVAFSLDGKTIASGGGDNTLRLWNAQTGMPVGKPLIGHKDNVFSVAFSPDGKTIVSGSEDNTLRLWNAQTGMPMGKPLIGHKGTVFSVAFSPDGKTIVSGSRDNTLRLWNAQTGMPIGKPLIGHKGTVFSVAFSPDGKTIVSGSRDNTLRLWNAQTGMPMGKPLIGHGAGVRSVAFSPDGKTIASGSTDKTIRLWNAQTGMPTGKPLIGHKGEVFSVAFSSNGKTIASSSMDKTIRLWNASLGSLQIACTQLQNHAMLTYPTMDISKQAQTTCKQSGLAR